MSNVGGLGDDLIEPVRPNLALQLNQNLNQEEESNEPYCDCTCRINHHGNSGKRHYLGFWGDLSWASPNPYRRNLYPLQRGPPGRYWSWFSSVRKRSDPLAVSWNSDANLQRLQ